MRQFQIRPNRRPDGALSITVAFDASVNSLSPVEQGRVYERAMSVALEAAKTATDPVIQRERDERSNRPLHLFRGGVTDGRCSCGLPASDHPQDTRRVAVG